MTTHSEVDYDRAAARIGRMVAMLGTTGTVVAFFAGGWKWGAGFFLGALFSAMNYQLLKRVVDALGGSHPPRRRTIAVAFRYLILGLVVYGILRFTSISLLAVFAGVFVLTAAVIVEAAIEIIYARE